MSSVILAMNELLSAWTDVHDIFSRIHVSFTTDGQFINFNGCTLMKIDPELRMEYAKATSESICYIFNSGRMIQLDFAWPEDAGPVLSAATVSYSFPGSKNEHVTFLDDD